MRLLKAIAAGAMLRTHMYLEGIEKTDYMETFPELIAAIDELDEDGLMLLEQEEKRKDSNYYRVIRCIADNDSNRLLPAQNLLDFAIAVLLYPQFGALLKKMNSHIVTVELAYFMENIDFPSYKDMKELYNRAEVILNVGSEEGAFFHTPFFADNRLLGYICGDDKPDERLKQVAELFLADSEMIPLMGAHEMCKSLEEIISCGEESVIIKGEKGRGRKFVLCHAMKRLGKNMIIADIDAIFKKNKNINETVRLIRREAIFQRCGVCFHGITKSLLEKADITEQEFISCVAQPFISEHIPVYFCTDMQTELMPYIYMPVRYLVYDKLDRKEGIALWQSYAKYYGIDIDETAIGSKYKFTPDEIKRACFMIKSKSKNVYMDESHVSEILGSILPPVLTKGRVEQYHQSCTFENLILAPDTKEKLKEICANVWYSHKVYDNWNMESKYAYGKAVSVLLAGPPGTGKTMTARVISDMLKLPLYHVNLSQMVDKYIGETEKHLEEIFTNAERSNIILFFDEADAIFGKRSEVKEAKDRYANTEVSYILQRIEEYEGIILLSTNNMGNIDSAFMRRMKYVIKFKLPDEHERLEIWKSCFPKESPTEGIDFEYLSKQFEFTGSNIKNIVLSAAFLAAKDNMPITMKHIITGVVNEHQKSGKLTFTIDLGKYSYLAK